MRAVRPDPEHHHFVAEGSGMAATKIYFKSEETRHTCLMALPDDTSLYARGDPPEHC